MAYLGLIGHIGLCIAFVGVAVSVISFLLSHLLTRKPKTKKQLKIEARSGVSNLIPIYITRVGYIAVFASAATLTLCCALLVYCFMTGDASLEYVVNNQSRAVGGDAWLYRLAGLWGGREGSLLFWAWLISMFNLVIAIRNRKKLDKLDTMALFVSQLVLAAFVGAVLFSDANFPFKLTNPLYLDAHGNLTNMASMLLGMNPLLEHWAMAIHPPALFVGYAGLTIPFAYAASALIINDPSKKWVERCTRPALISWLFLGLGIGLGAVWAYVVLGWGGYWGWDPVENASLLSWLVGLALIHCLTMYRSRNAFRRWSVMCACITLAFVIFGTFIIRSGIVSSVHAFAGDPVSYFLFLSLIIAPILTGIIGLLFRWKSFGPSEEEQDLVESLTSRDTAYYLNNVIMIVLAILLCYLTISSALPEWLPFGGESTKSGLYNTLARPMGIFYCLILAVCPLLSWKKTTGKNFWKRARLPGACALVVFALLAVYWYIVLIPNYQATILAGGETAEILREYGAAWYYNGLALFGFLVASLLFFNALFLIGRNLRAYKKAHGTSLLTTFTGMLKNRASMFGGFIAHLAMSFILVGLIGSSMYVVEKASYLVYDPDTDTVSGDFRIQDYRLKYTGNTVKTLENGKDVLYETYFDIYKDDVYIGSVSPSMHITNMFQSIKTNAGIFRLPGEDVFVVFHDTALTTYQSWDVLSEKRYFSLDVRINPLISFVWIGFALMMIGIAVSIVGKRNKPESKSENAPDNTSRNAVGNATKNKPESTSKNAMGKKTHTS